MPHYDRHGRVAPEDFLATLRGFDAILLGAVGWPARLPDHITLAPLIRMRQAFDLYACVRPARTFPGVRGPLRSQEPIDLVVVRENSEGEYVDNGGVTASGTPDEVAVQTAVHTRRGVERILRFSFELARTRRRRLDNDYQVERAAVRVSPVGSRPDRARAGVRRRDDGGEAAR